MDYMARHGARRARPAELVPGTASVVTVRLDYWPGGARDAGEVLADPSLAYVSRYALGRDYHKVMRARLQELADRMVAELGALPYRVFTDSAPVMEVALAARAGLGWRGKHTLLLSRDAGSLLTSSASSSWASTSRGTPPSPATAAPASAASTPAPRAPSSRPTSSTRAAASPTSPSRTRARSPRSSAPPWATASTAATTASSPARGTSTPARRRSRTSRCATASTPPPSPGSSPGRDDDFDARLEGSAIRRIGHDRWLRNIAVALGNAPSSDSVIAALRSRADDPDPLVREHVHWALARHRSDTRRRANGRDYVTVSVARGHAGSRTPETQTVPHMDRWFRVGVRFFSNSKNHEPQTETAPAHTDTAVPTKYRVVLARGVPSRQRHCAPVRAASCYCCGVTNSRRSFARRSSEGLCTYIMCPAS